MSKKSETITENIFREYYGSSTFLEKSAIPDELGSVASNVMKNFIFLYLQQKDVQRSLFS